MRAGLACRRFRIASIEGTRGYSYGPETREGLEILRDKGVLK